MVLESKIEGGIRIRRPGRGPLLSKGRNEFDYRSLARSEREFIDALAKARIVTILERDAPAVVVPLRRSEPPPAEESKPLRRRGGHRREKAG